MRVLWAARAGLVTAACLSGAASAADADLRDHLQPIPASEWTVTLGAEGRIEPIFQGSNHDGLFPYPIVAVRHAGTPEPLRGPRDGVGIGIIDGGNFQIGPVGQLRLPRRARAGTATQGLGTVPWAVELGVFGEYWWTPWLRGRAELRQGFNGHHGVASDLFADAVVPVGPQWTLSGGPRVTLASTAATAPYFSIDAVQSLASGLPPFDAKGGVRSVGAGTQARYLLTPDLATHAFIEYERLTGGAAGSPLVVQRGSANQVSVGFGATRSFDVRSPW